MISGMFRQMNSFGKGRPDQSIYCSRYADPKGIRRFGGDTRESGPKACHRCDKRLPRSFDQKKKDAVAMVPDIEVSQ